MNSTVAQAIEAGGYYPTVILDALNDALASESVTAFVVQHEPTFDHEEVRRHMTVMALTATRLITVHTDEHSSNEGAFTTTAVEAVPLSKINSVNLTRIVMGENGVVSEAMLSVNWGSLARIELEPVNCPDPECQADHGLTGTLGSDDISLRISSTAEGPEAVQQLLEFSRQLSIATVRS